MSTINPTDYWAKKLASYQKEEWSSLPNYFAKNAVIYFPKKSEIVETPRGASLQKPK